MQEIRRRRTEGAIWLRAEAPKYIRALALLMLVAGLVAVGVSYWRLRDRNDFKMIPGPARLSTEVVGEINNLEHREMRDGKLAFLLRASLDRKFSDGHHELENVHLEVYPAQGDDPDKITALRTITNQDNSQFWFSGNVQIETRDRLVAKSEAVEYNMSSEIGVVTSPLTFERENVSGRSDTATLDSKNKILDLKGAVEITVKPDAAGAAEADPTTANLRGRPVTIKSASASFHQEVLRLAFVGGAVAEQGQDVMSGDTLTGVLNEHKRLKQIEGRGNSYLRSASEGRAAEAFAANMDFYFDSEQKLQRALAAQNVRARTLDADAEAEVKAPDWIDISFAVQGERSLLKEMRTAGRSVLTLLAPKSKASDPKAANKRLTADSVHLVWRATGRDLERAEAEGNAELLVDPVQSTPTADRKTLFARRFDCEFFEVGNLARTFTSTGGSRAVIEPLQPGPQRAVRTLTSPTMVAQFVRETQDVERIEAREGAHFQEVERTLTAQNMTALFSRETRALDRLDAQGDARFNERDRYGQAATMSYTAADEMVRMRGGEPTVWDARARLKAPEIDSDTRNKVSYARGRVNTTYYSQEQTGGAAPFAKVKSPVFVAASTAEFQHDTGIGIYTGNARMWQDDNYVNADRIVLRREQKRMEGEGNVRSALYNARRKDPSGARVVVPVSATSNRMAYTEAERLLQYAGSVDIRQGTERITSNTADVFLLKDTYEVERTIAKQNVVVTQPGKRGTGDWAQYTAADETVMLTGNPARVEDAAQGNSESRRLTIFLREDRVVSDAGESKGSTGRVRTTHRIKKQ
jgi:LPS export ABC transporter protein LptC/lipopolysaccharide transport protein LptA